MNIRSGLGVGLLMALMTASVAAENKTLSIPASADIALTSLADHNLTETTVITVQPQHSTAGEGDPELPNHCLLSVTVQLDGGDVELTPGMMVCINAERVPLEAAPDADIEGLGECVVTARNGCVEYSIRAGEQGELNLRTDMVLKPQPRSE